MRKSNLVVMTGYPCSGKSEIADYLTNNHNFAKLSIDQFRNSFYNKNFIELMESEVGKKKDMIAWEILQGSKLTFLREGFDVVVDSTAQYHDTRDYLFSTHIPELDFLPVNKYLAWINTDRELLIKRNLEKGRQNNVVKSWDETWQDPIESPSCEIIKYINNVPSDRDKVYRDLDRRFSASK